MSEHQSAEFPKHMPATQLYAAVNAAAAGTHPPFNALSFVDQLGLAGPEPDGLTVIQRLAGDEPLSPASLRAIVGVARVTQALLHRANRRETNSAQEIIAGCIGYAVTRQVMREGDICPAARDIVDACTRDDIIPPDIRARLATSKLQDRPLTDADMEAAEAFLATLDDDAQAPEG